MKEAFWGYWLVLLGVFVTVVMLLVQNVTSNNTEDHYTLNQISEAAIEDAVDIGYYTEYGELKINKEKFMESFLRRMVDSISATDEYRVVFTAIYEAPPKVSVEITSKTDKFNIANDLTDVDITSRIDGILEINSSKSNRVTPPAVGPKKYTITYVINTACTERSDVFYGGFGSQKFEENTIPKNPGKPVLLLNYCATCMGDQNTDPQTFVRWRTADGSTYNFSKPITSDITLYAVWDTNGKCK